MTTRIWPLQFAAETLRAGGVIAYPTEAVWGLGCDPFNEQAVQRLLALKQRAQEKGLILIGGDPEHFAPWLEHLSLEQNQTLAKGWPGFKTWLVPDPGIAPVWIRGQHTAVALRVSAHPLVRALCRTFGGPIVSTSANIAGRAAARHPWQVAGYFKKELDYVLVGSLGGERQVSPIRDLQSGQIIRGR